MTDPSQLTNSSLLRAINYSAEYCACCNGTGAVFDGACAACKGKGDVMVLQPSRKCPRCRGNGKPVEADRAIYYNCLCLVCRGTGWVLTLEQ